MAHNLIHVEADGKCQTSVHTCLKEEEILPSRLPSALKCNIILPWVFHLLTHPTNIGLANFHNHVSQFLNIFLSHVYILEREIYICRNIYLCICMHKYYIYKIKPLITNIYSSLVHIHKPSKQFIYLLLINKILIFLRTFDNSLQKGIYRPQISKQRSKLLYLIINILQQMYPSSLRHLIIKFLLIKMRVSVITSDPQYHL